MHIHLHKFRGEVTNHVSMDSTDISFSSVLHMISRPVIRFELQIIEKKSDLAFEDLDAKLFIKDALFQFAICDLSNERQCFMANREKWEKSNVGFNVY